MAEQHDTEKHGNFLFWGQTARLRGSAGPPAPERDSHAPLRRLHSWYAAAAGRRKSRPASGGGCEAQSAERGPRVKAHESRMSTARVTRRAGLRLAAGGAAAAGAVALTGPLTTAAPTSLGSLDARVLNFALVLERLQVQFYGSALERAGLAGEQRDFAAVALGHERKHVARLSSVLGDRAEQAPSFTLDKATSDAKRFLSTAIALEDLAVYAYNGQVTNLSRTALKLATEIVSVEGRHAAWIRDLAGLPPAPRAADLVLPSRAVLQRLGAMKLVNGLGGGEL
jgi:rubrerythrin